MNTLARTVTSARSLVLFAVAAASLAACHKKKPVVVAPEPTRPPAVNQDSIDRERRRADSIAQAAARARAVADSLARLAAQRDAALTSARTALTAAVFFDYDAAEIRDDARATLESKLPLLTANSGLRLRIAGHTDSRGSDEYNLALGQRRASSVKAFLTERGIDSNRLEIASFGRERGVCSEEAESCWSRNRRAEFEIIAGGDNLVLPNR
jgi:peptidoglycan-associated lipoprotein